MHMPGWLNFLHRISCICVVIYLLNKFSANELLRSNTSLVVNGFGHNAAINFNENVRAQPTEYLKEISLKVEEDQ